MQQFSLLHLHVIPYPRTRTLQEFWSTVHCIIVRNPRESLYVASRVIGTRSTNVQVSALCLPVLSCTDLVNAHIAGAWSALFLLSLSEDATMCKRFAISARNQSCTLLFGFCRPAGDNGRRQETIWSMCHRFCLEL